MSFLSFWRWRVSSCPTLAIKLDSPFFRFTTFSSFSVSSPSQITTPTDVISDLLTKECGFSSSQMATVMRSRPALLRTKSDHTAREVIHVLKDSGLTENKLRAIILRFSTILALKVDTQLKPKMEFLKKMGMSTQDIAGIILKQPRLLGLNIENCLAPRILHLETLFGSQVHVCKALKRAPALLSCDFEKKVKPKVEYLKNTIGIHEGSRVFVGALSVVINLSFENLEAKIKHMASLGLAEEDIGQILKVHPRVLLNSTKKMKDTFDFLTRTAGLQPKIVASNIMILDQSLEKRLKPRYEVFKSLMTNPHANGPSSLIKFFRLSERAFQAKFGQYNTQV